MLITLILILIFAFFTFRLLQLAHVYHTVKHNMSYIRADCANKWLHWTVSDSKLVKKMSCGRTKAETIVKNVLAPKSVAEVVNILKGLKPIPFSIQTDASNKGNQNMFPLSIQYFTPKSGVTQKMIDFLENPNESADGIVGCIENSLEQLSLTLDQVSAFSADNTNVNYGVHNSVYTKLKKNSYLLTGNCHAHIVHNTVKICTGWVFCGCREHCSQNLCILLKLCKKKRKYKNLVSFVMLSSVSFCVMLWRDGCPWTLPNAALKSYLMSLGVDCPRHLRILLNLNMDAEELQEKGDVVEVYLLYIIFSPSLKRWWRFMKKMPQHLLICMPSWSLSWTSWFRGEMMSSMDKTEAPASSPIWCKHCQRGVQSLPQHCHQVCQEVVWLHWGQLAFSPAAFVSPAWETWLW